MTADNPSLETITYQISQLQKQVYEVLASLNGNGSPGLKQRMSDVERVLCDDREDLKEAVKNRKEVTDSLRAEVTDIKKILAVLPDIVSWVGSFKKVIWIGAGLVIVDIVTRLMTVLNSVPK
jgi:ABC-type transporter Mla subunit MlaD